MVVMTGGHVGQAARQSLACYLSLAPRQSCKIKSVQAAVPDWLLHSNDGFSATDQPLTLQP